MVNKKFQYLPHTAEVAFVAYGKDLKVALENAAEALLNVMLDLKKIRKSDAKEGTVHIREAAESTEDLVWYVLQDILTKVDEKKLRAYEFRVKELRQSVTGKTSLSGNLVFKKLKEDPFLLEVKGVTPHNLRVRKGKSGYTISVLVDV